jgi:hypothetical protein
MDTEQIARLEDVDDIRALTILDTIRGDLKRGAAPAVEPAILFGSLRARLAPSRRPSEEVVLASIQLLVEYCHAGDKTTVAAAVNGALPALVPHLGRDRVRR